MNAKMDKGQWTVTEAEEGERLDRFLAAHIEGISRSKLQVLIKEGRVKIDAREQRKAGTPLNIGDSIETDFPAEEPLATREESVQRLEILHEDEDLLVVNKPAGLLTHRRDAGNEVSLADLAEAYCGPLPSPQGEDRPGIVHRLDRETSGVIVLGKNEVALEELLRQFREREVTKTYALLVSGEPRFTSDWIEEPLGRDPRRPERISVLDVGEGGRAASTFYEVQERLDGFAFLHCQPKTGRTHQIRVHMNAIGIDVVGDRVYRVRNSTNPKVPSDAPKAHRQMLHARRIELRHPKSGKAVSFESPLPADFEALLLWLRAAKDRAWAE